MSTVTLNPVHKQLFQVQPQQSHPRLSVSRVLYVRFLRWLDKASPSAVFKALRKFTTLLLISLFLTERQFMTALLLDVMTWNSFRIPTILGLCSLALNWKRLLRIVKRAAAPRGNQHTYRGLPVGELSSFLKETMAFKMDEAMKRFALTQPKWKEVAEDLEKHGVLTRGESNARVLRPISLENLVRQLRDGFPLVWDEERELWLDRDGPFNRWVLSQEFSRRKLSEETDRKERKLERIEKKIEQAQSHPLFASLAV